MNPISCCFGNANSDFFPFPALDFFLFLRRQENLQLNFFSHIKFLTLQTEYIRERRSRETSRSPLAALSVGFVIRHVTLQKAKTAKNGHPHTPKVDGQMNLDERFSSLF
eukprot:TRINITY_DN1259_c0_g1_i4.p3 TRINITY_DN1259_c0_g1~~TRINITY_DN1259_c0_g1_i4.p3  ORF type:complete len:109 (-),score=6.99 TRINITY_DN1259_c0_g1_i4:201-527(-)